MEVFTTQNLHSLKAVGQHLMHSARNKGEDTSKLMAFVGLMTVFIGVAMLMKGMEQGRGRGL